MFSQQMPGGNAQQRRQASARYPTMSMKGDNNRTASNSLNRQQQSGTNLHMIGKPVQVANQKKMKLIRTRPSAQVSAAEKLGKGGGAGSVSQTGADARHGTNRTGKIQSSSNQHGRQPSLTMSSNQFLKGGPGVGSGPHSMKNQSGTRAQPQSSDPFLFSATSPHVQINKQAVLMNQTAGQGSHHPQQHQQRPMTGKSKESLGHITASRRQKQAGLQINIEGCQSIVINQPQRGHVVASPGSVSHVPDNMLFQGTAQGQNTMSPARQHDSLNQMSPNNHHAANQIASRRQPPSSMSKKQLRQKPPGGHSQGPDDMKNQNLQLAGGNQVGPKGVQTQALQPYQITPKNAGQTFEQIGGPRSTKARASHSFTKGRFIDTTNNQHNVQHTAANRVPHSPTSQQAATLSTLEQQQKVVSQRDMGDVGAETGQMLFLQSPPRRASNLMSPQHNPARTSTHASFRGGTKPSSKGKHSHHPTNANNSTLGIKTSNTQSHANTLKIQNLRVYNETSTAGMPQTKNSVTTKHENTKKYAMRNNFVSSAGVADSWGVPFSPEKAREHARNTTSSNMRHFHNQSSSSAVGYSLQGTNSTKPMTKKRKLTLNQRASGGPSSSIRPMSGAVRGPASRGQNQSYSLRTNVTYASPLTQQQNQSINASTRQSTTGAMGKNIQILSPGNHHMPAEQQQQRVYSPNAALNGRRDINQELKNLNVPQFYPQTTSNAQAPRQIQFTKQGQQQQVLVQQIAPGLNPSHIHQVQQNEQSSSCLIEEPELVISAKQTKIVTQGNEPQHLNQKDALQMQQQYDGMTSQVAEHDHGNMMSSTHLSMDQPSHQFSSQQVAYNQSRQALFTEGNSDGLRQQSIQNQPNITQQTSFEGVSDINKQLNQSRQSIQNDNSRSSNPKLSQQANQHSSASASKLNLLQQQQKVIGLQGKGQQEKAGGGPLVIPNFAINLPQSTTASTAPKLNARSMLLALDPISKNSKDINQKLQQRKVDSARQASDQQSQQPQHVHQQVAHQKKLANNLQVIVTHEINPVVSLQNGTAGLKPQPATTTNSTKIVPSLDFQSQQQQQFAAQNGRPSQQQTHRQNSITTGAQHVSELNTSAQSRQQSQRDSNRHSRQPSSYRQNPMVNPQSHRSAQNAEGGAGANRKFGDEILFSQDVLGTSQQPKQQLKPTQAKTMGSQQSPKRGAKASSKNGGGLSYTQSQQTAVPGTAPSQNLYNGASSQQQLKIPMTPAKCLKQFGQRSLTDYEKTEILDFPQVYYFGEGVKKIHAQKPPPNQSQSNARDNSKNRGSNANQREEEEDNNCGYDDSKGNYRVVMKDHIAYRYEIVEHLGRGSFGVAVKCFDHKTQEHVALKIIKNKKKYYYQAGVELKILQFLKDNDPDDTMNIIHMKDYVIFRKHLCITFELMSINLYEFLKLNDFEGLSLSLVRRFAIQLLYSLKFLKENDVIHCDLKPENILLKDPSKSGIKIIDFGSSCFQDERVYTYIQSRFYRAPEIILGIPYTPCIDMWSFGCIMAEFAMGYPIFPGEDETDQISLIMEVCGIPQSDVLAKGQRKTKFFNESNMPKLVPNSRGKVRKPGTKVLEDILECSDQSFVNFVERCLEWDPEKRMTPDEAIRHQWILEGLPPKVLVHHQKLHSINTKSLPEHIRSARAEYLASQPLDVQMEFRDEDEDEDSQSTVSYSRGGGGRGALLNHSKSKSLDRTAGHANLNAGGQAGHHLVLKNKRPVKQGSLQSSSGPHYQGGTRNHRPSQSQDNTAYRHSNVSANTNASQHHNLRAKKQSVGHKGVPNGGGGDGKPTIEQMLHASQRQ